MSPMIGARDESELPPNFREGMKSRRKKAPRRVGAGKGGGSGKDRKPRRESAG